MKVKYTGTTVRNGKDRKITYTGGVGTPPVEKEDRGGSRVKYVGGAQSRVAYNETGYKRVSWQKPTDAEMKQGTQKRGQFDISAMGAGNYGADKRISGNVGQGFLDRAGNTISGGLKGSLAGNMDALGVAYQAGQGGRTQRDTAALKDAQWAVARAKRDYDVDKSPSNAAALDNALRQMKAFSTVLGDGAYTQALNAAYAAADQMDTADLNQLYNNLGAVNVNAATGVQQKATEASRDLAMQVQQNATRDIEQAKEGLGTFGQMVVDAGASMAQMGGDLATNALLGTHGSMIPFATRAFGGASMQAREGGGDLKQQIAYGAAQAGKEVLTEKMFNMALPFAKAYGGGALDDVTQRAIQTAVDKLGKTAAGKRALNAALQLTASGVGEGLEELIGDWMEWQMPRIYGGDVDTAGETLANSLYDFVVGGMAGVAGSVISPDTYSYGRYAADVRQNTALEMNAKAAEAVEAVTRGETITGNQAAAIARDPVAMEVLEANTGVKLNTQQPISALKKDISALASRDTAQAQTQSTTATPATQKRTQKHTGGFLEAGQRAYREMSRTAEDAPSLYAGFSSVYNAGLNGIDAGKAKGKYAAMLTPEQRYAAYNAGLEDARAQVARENAEVASVTTTAGAGLADNEYSRYLIATNKDTASTLNAWGKKLGVRIEVVDQVLGGRANGQYIKEQNLIQIAADSDKPLLNVTAHEITHRMQDLSPAEYRKFRQAALEYKMQEAGADTEAEIVEKYMAAAESEGVTLTRDDVMDELAADFAGDMLDDAELFSRFAKENRTAAQKLLDSLKEFLSKVKSLFTGKYRDMAAQEAYGKNYAELEDLAKQWQAAFDAAERQAEKAKTAAGEGDGVRYMIRSIDGETMTVIDTENDTRDFNAAEAYLKTLVDADHPFSTILADAQPVYVGKDLPGEYKSSEYTKTMKPALRKIKMQAATNLDEMLLLAENGEWKENVKTKHSKDAQNGWYRYDTRFAVPILDAKKAIDHYAVYGGTLLIRNDADGKSYLYDLLDVEKKKVISKTSFSAETHSEVTSPKPSDTSIPADGENVKPQFSLKATDSTGRKLSEQQQEFFKDSKVRDAEGRLMPVYHATYDNFTVFDRGKLGSLTDGNATDENFAATSHIGFWFNTKDLSKTAGLGSRREKVYLDISNPYMVSSLDALVQTMDGYEGTAAEKGSEFETQLRVEGYDGVVVQDEEFGGTSYIALDAKQIKRVDNAAPTIDPDIRLSLKATAEVEREARELKKERNALAKQNEMLKQRVQELKGEMRISKEPSVVARDVKKLGQNLIREYGSDVRYADIQSEMDALAKAVMKRDVSMSDLMPHAKAVADAIVDNTTELTEYGAELLEIRDYLKNRTIQFNGEMANYNEFRKSNISTLHLNKTKGLPVDVLYAEMTEMFGEGYFPGDVYTEADKLYRIADVVSGIEEIYRNPFEGYRDAAAQEIANQLIDGMISDQVRQKTTFADRRALEKQEAVGRVRNMLSRERQNRKEQVSRLRREFSEKTKAGREKRNATARRAQIARHTAAMSRKLLHPTDKQHIPENLRVAVANLLGYINLESAYSLKPGTEHYVVRKDGKQGGLVGKHIAHGEGTPTKRTLEADKLKTIYNEIADSEGNMVVDPALTEPGGLLDSLSALGNKRVAEMTSSELETVWNAIRAIEATLTSYDRTFSSAKYQRTSEWAGRFAEDSASRRRVNRKISLDLADPYTFFSAYGDAGKQVYRVLRNAQDQQHVMLMEVQREASKFLDENVFKNRAERHTFTTSRGEELILTNEQIINLYNLARRGEQAINHLTNGGIVQPEIKRDGKLKTIPRGDKNIVLSLEDIRAITSVLTPEQIKVANGLQKIASTLLAEWGNDASMTVYGYRKFKEEHYWPITSAKDAVASSVEKDSDNARSIKNMGSAKALTPNASNALDIGGVYDVFAKNASDMIKYATLLAPMEDINRLYNFRYRDSAGHLTGRNMRQVLSSVYGDASHKYWRNLMRDMQNGMAHNASDTTKAVERIVGNTKGAAVGANWRVVIQQPTAYFRAAAILDPQNMAKGIAGGVTSGNGWDKARRWAPIAGIKDTSGFDQGSRYTIAREVYGTSDGFIDKLGEWSSRGAAKADAITWDKIWNACEWQVSSNTDLEVGSDAFYQQVADVFTDVIDQSQVVDGIMQRTQIMRDSDALTRQATSFMGEPLKSLNMLMRAYDAWVYENNPQKRSAALKRMKRTVASLLVTDIINSLAQSIIDGLRDDDKDKKYLARVLEALTGISGDEENGWEVTKNVLLAGNLKDNITLIGRIPYAKDIISIMQGYTVDRMDAGAVDDIVKATKSMFNSANGKGGKTPAYAAKQLLTAGSKIFGVSVANLGRDVWSLARSIANETGNVRVMFEMEKAIYRMDRSAGNRKRWCELLYRAQKENDKDTARLIYKEMLSHGYEEKDVRSGVEAIMKQEQGVTSVNDLKSRWMTP